MVNSVVDSKVVSTRKERQQNKLLINLFTESDTALTIRQNCHENQSGDGANTVDEKKTTVNNGNNSKFELTLHKLTMDIHKLGSNIDSEVRDGVDIVMTSVETTVPKPL